MREGDNDLSYLLVRHALSFYAKPNKKQLTRLVCVKYTTIRSFYKTVDGVYITLVAWMDPENKHDQRDKIKIW
jgi:hypothetical protein